MMHIPSRYNLALQEANGKTFVNLVTEAVLEVDSDHLLEVEAVLQAPDAHAGSEAFETLLNLGFLVDAEFDELAFLKLRHTAARYGNDHLGLSILPTLRCNLRCAYCFQDHLDLDMDEKTQSRLLKYVERKLRAKRGLYVSWFGGEPLLRLDMIRDLSAAFIALCESGNSEHTGQITSNGLLLTPPVAKELVDLGVQYAQVTLDGPRSTHDTRRVLPTGEGTYTRILRNVLDIANFLPVRIRVNLDQGTVDRAEELLDDLEPVREKVSLGFYPVMPTPTAHKNDLKCLSNMEFSPFQRDLQQEALRRGFQLASDYALSGTVHCGAYQLDTHVVDPRGDIFMCVENAGQPEQRRGYLTGTGSIELIYPKLLPWATWSPFDDEACVACIALPLCMGGCLRLKDADPDERCFFKRSLEQRIRSKVKSVGTNKGKEVTL